MLFVDIPFPRRIAMGAQRSTGWSTSLATVQSGRESTNQNWTKARHSFDVAFAVRAASDYAAVVEHFHQVRGRAKAFPFKDALDYQASQANGVLLDDGESPTTGYQLAKRYGSGANRYDRVITRPIASTFELYRTRSGTTSTITGSASLDATTGIVQVAGGVYLPGDVLSWSGQFYVPCRYDVDELPAVVVNRRPGEAGELLVQCDAIPIVEVRDP